MDSPSARPAIFAPFGEAFELTRKILFQPFDIGKWFVIGFGAWLATFLNGFGFNYRYNFNRDGTFSQWMHNGRVYSFRDIPTAYIPFVVGGLIFAFALVVLLLWLNARARFIFTDCIVRNRGAFLEPWREYHEEGNSYFCLNLLVALCTFLVFGGLAILFLISWYWRHPIFPLALLILLAVVLALVAIVVTVIMHLIVPVMYRQRCGAVDAFAQLWNLILTYPSVFVLYALFCIVLLMAAGMIGCIATCATCCIAMLPYVGTVILLPVVMVLFAFQLCFLRQFGEQYDVWAGVKPVELPSAPPIPPVQEIPPPPPPV